MTDFTLDSIAKQKLRNAVDWVVFSFGAASLTIAIAATILSSSDNVASNEAPIADAIVLAS